MPLLDVRPENWSCYSIFESKEVRLTHEYVGAALSFRVEYAAPWSISWLMPQLMVQVFIANQEIVQIQPRYVQSCRKGKVRFAATFAAMHMTDHTTFYVRLLATDCSTPLATVSFNRLDLDQLLNELRVSRLEVYTKLGGQIMVTQAPHGGLEHLGARLEIELSNREHRELFSQITAQVSLALACVHDIVHWTTPLQFGPERFVWDVSMNNALTMLRQQPGKYQLGVLLENHGLAKLELNVLSAQHAYGEAVMALESLATLSHWTYEAVNHRGQNVALDFVAEDFRAIHVEATIDLPHHDRLFSSISLPLTCVLRTRNTGAMISGGIHNATLLRGANNAALKLDLHPHNFRLAERDCVLELRLGNREMAAISVVYITRNEITAQKTARLRDNLTISDVELTVLRENESLNTDVVFATDQRLRLRFTARSEGFDEDFPYLVWPLTIQIRQTATRHIYEQAHRLRIRPGINSYPKLVISINQLRTRLPPGRCTLSLLCADRLLGEHELRLLAEDEILPYTRQIIRENVQVLDKQLICQLNGYDCVTLTVPFFTTQFRVRFTLKSHGFNAALPECRLALRLTLAQKDFPALATCQTEVNLSSNPVTFELPVTLTEPWPTDYSGEYQFELHLLNKEIGRIRFNVVSESHIIQRLEVNTFAMLATTHPNGTPAPFEYLSRQDHQELIISFSVQSEIPVPGFAIPGRIEIRAKKRVLFSADFHSPLGGQAITQVLKPLPTEYLWSLLGEQDRKLDVHIKLGGELKCRKPLHLRVQARLTTFDGALKADAQSLGNVDDEYQDIIREIHD